MFLRQQVEDLFDDGKHFCIYPWIHLHVTGFGNLAPCCVSFSQGYGSLNTNSFEDLWQSQPIRDFRLKMLNDEMEPDCSACYNWEKSGGFSFRKEYNSRYRKYIDWVVNTEASGYSPDAKPIYWDIRFSNNCNLSCRTCCSVNSSSWLKDEKSLFNKSMTQQSNAFLKQMHPAFEIGLNDSKILLSDLEEHFDSVDYVYCAGGEPLLIEENLEILKKLDSYNNNDVSLVFNTNLTQLEKSVKYIDYWKKFKNLEVIVSIDGSHERGEYIRKGIIWNNIISNLNLLKQECPHARIVINFTVSVLNILHLPDFHKEIVENGYIEANQLKLNILFDPEIYTVQILPESLKKIAESRISQHFVWLKEQSPFNKPENNQYYLDYIKQFQACIDTMYSEDCTNLIPEFSEYTNSLDELRGENLISIFPELETMINYQK